MLRMQAFEEVGQ